MSKITDFRHPNDSSFVGWVSGGKVIKMIFDYNIYAIPLKSEDRILVVELNGERNNAYVFNAEGIKVKNVLNPDAKARCFGDVYYIKDELTLVSVRRDASMRAVVINNQGDVLRTYETR